MFNPCALTIGPNMQSVDDRTVFVLLSTAITQPVNNEELMGRLSASCETQEH